MGSIVSFMPRPTPAKRADPVEGGAAVVIFPGVRYERQPEADLTPFQPAQAAAAQIPLR